MTEVTGVTVNGEPLDEYLGREQSAEISLARLSENKFGPQPRSSARAIRNHSKTRSRAIPLNYRRLEDEAREEISAAIAKLKLCSGLEHYTLHDAFMDLWLACVGWDVDIPFVEEIDWSRKL